MVNIRKATLADAPAIVALARSTFYDTYAVYNTAENMDKYLSENFTLPKVESEFEEPNGVFLLAFHENELAAYAKLHTIETPASLAGRKHLELERIYVERSFQRLKLGSTLLKACMDTARENDFDTLWLGVWQKNTKAIAFYEALGFKVFDTHIFVLGDDPQEDFLMKIDLK